MPGIRQLLGDRGERAAARFLRRRGFTIVERNYRCRFGEIDLIAIERDTVVFIEVKTRTRRDYGEPIEAVDWHKQRQIIRVATHYIRRHRLEDRQVRFDVVGIRPNGLRWEVELIRNAFEARWG
jgi:putative endonuclease